MFAKVHLFDDGNDKDNDMETGFSEEDLKGAIYMLLYI